MESEDNWDEIIEELLCEEDSSDKDPFENCFEYVTPQRNLTFSYRDKPCRYEVPLVEHEGVAMPRNALSAATAIARGL